MSNEQKSERVAALLEARPGVAHEVEQVQRAREGSLNGARAIARGLRPSGGLGKELREHPLQVLGIAAALALIGLRWITGGRSQERRGDGSRAPSEGAGVVSAFAAGLAAAAAERGGRAVIDALLDGRPANPGSASARTPIAPVDETGGGAHDDRGRVAKR